jgi:23S rRNA (cytidine1920-2'-O)/16S rRNA (cytidine1409-2'-O)-methyltransferase
LTLVLDALLGVVDPRGDLVLMVKPQFEVGKELVGKGGVVRDPSVRAQAVIRVADEAAARGWGARAVTTSPLPGPSGNVEFFLWLQRGDPSVDAAAIREEVIGVPPPRTDRPVLGEAPEKVGP